MENSEPSGVRAPADDSELQAYLEQIKLMLDKGGMSAEGKSFIISCLWTQEHIPEITSDTQYAEYQKLQDRLEQSLPPRSDPNWGQAYVEFCRTPEGILAQSYAARMIEWEESQEGDETC
jgi:hypothetical protein